MKNVTFYSREIEYNQTLVLNFGRNQRYLAETNRNISAKEVVCMINPSTKTGRIGFRNDHSTKK